MSARRGFRALATLAVAAGLLAAASAAVRPTTQTDALPSWNDGPTKRAITDFVARVTTPGSPTFVPVAERIATFDNDGTLWSEQPIYFQFAFALDRVKTLAVSHPEWQAQEPFKSALAGDAKGLAASGEKGLAALILATHTRMTTDEFHRTVTEWIETARHPRFKRRYIELIYQPMLEVLNLLRRHDFKVYIVSGGTVEFMRAWTEGVYGIPPEHVIGTTFVTKFEAGPGGVPRLMREPTIEFIDDGPGKPVAINKFIGRRPVASFGNSDGDLEMLQWTAAGTGARFALYVRHTDAEREWAYDRQSHIGRLDKGLDEAGRRGWTVVDMKQDWKVIYPFQR